VEVDWLHLEKGRRWHWSRTCEGHAGGEGPEVLGAEVFSMRQETVVRHGKEQSPKEGFHRGPALLRSTKRTEEEGGKF
jgi:hypothetical protein